MKADVIMFSMFCLYFIHHICTKAKFISCGWHLHARSNSREQPTHSCSLRLSMLHQQLSRHFSLLIFFFTRPLCLPASPVTVLFSLLYTETKNYESEIRSVPFCPQREGYANYAKCTNYLIKYLSQNLSTLSFHLHFYVLKLLVLLAKALVVCGCNIPVSLSAVITSTGSIADTFKAGTRRSFC